MIYVITHKIIELPFKKSGYQLLQVGFNEDIPGVLRDNTGDNIAEKNASYCELTGLYWIWKNRDDAIVGIDHYRRYFVNHIYSKIDRFIPIKYRILSFGKANRILKTYDVILPVKWEVTAESVESHYKQNHHYDDLKVIKSILDKYYPEYLPEYNNYMTQKYSYMCNMFIMRRELMVEYCEFLFDVLLQSENNIDSDSFSPYQKRVFGYLSERLFNIWIMHNKLKVYEMQVYYNENL